jgi:hypothetical protein
MSTLQELQLQTPPRYDCSRLIHIVAEHEAILQTGKVVNFGHPDPPSMQIFAVSAELLLVVAFTPHFCYVQEQYTSTNDVAFQAAGEPIELCRFALEDGYGDEQITCVTIVSSDDALWLHEENTSNPIQSQSFQEGEMETLSHARIAIIVGTNTSRVYSVELLADTNKGRLLAKDFPLILCEVLPHDTKDTLKLLRRKRNQVTPFQPSGGVSTMTSFWRQGEQYVWITYGDGCLLRVHSIGLFPSVWTKGAASGQSVDDMLKKPALLRCHVTLTNKENGETRIIVPFFKSFPSPLSPLTRQPHRGPDGVRLDEDDTPMSLDLKESAREEEEESNETIEAMMFTSNNSFPAIYFLTSETKFTSRQNSRIENSIHGNRDMMAVVVGGAKAIVGGVFTGLLSSVSKMSSNRKVSSTNAINDDDDKSDRIDMDTLAGPFSTLWNEPVALFAGEELHDSPRQVDFCSIDPDGGFAVTADNLGRVMLIDLCAKQIIRMWKGYREASCYWIHSERHDEEISIWSARPHQLNLIIYSKQRRVVEVWRLRHGPRVNVRQVERGADVLPYSAISPSSRRASAFLIHSTIPGNVHQMEELDADFTLMPGQTNLPAAQSRKISSIRAETIKLQHLRQLLSTETLQFTKDDVYKALKQITSLADLALALDLTAQSSLLEDKLNIDGSEFQKLAVAHCYDILNEAVQGNRSELRTNPTVSSLSSKVLSYSQVC